MNAEQDDYLEQIQQDAHDLLLGVPKLALARHLIDNEGDIEAKVLKALAVLNDSSGRKGLAIITLLPKVDDAEKNLPGPRITVTQEIQVIEQVLINRQDGTGTGIRSSTAALRVLAALHLQTVGAVTWYADKPPVKPLPVKPGYVSHAVKFVVSLGMRPPTKPAGVSVTNSSGFYTLSCATPEAAIYYTLDGSLPRPGGGTANLYTDPIDTEPLTVGARFRAAAYLPDANPSDILEFIIQS